MEAFELLKNLETVKAPPDFELKLMAQISLRKRKQVRRRAVRFSLAGAFAGTLVLLLVINFFILPGRGPAPYPAVEGSALSGRDSGNRLQAGDTITIMEAVDYSSEIRTLSSETPTVYILEQVSWTADTKIRY